MTAPVSIYRGAASVVETGGQAVTAIYGPVQGGVIFNPATPDEQGIDVVEPLFVDIVRTAGIVETATTIPIQPGQSFYLPADQVNSVSVNAATSGHKFSVIAVQPKTPFPPTPNPGPRPFPPSGPTSLTKVIPSYLYKEYEDDDNLQAFVAAFNEYAQKYVDWFNEINLPIYTSPTITGDLLDWVAEGLYGIKRPTLPSGQNRNLGPYNTFAYNTLAYNEREVVGPDDYSATSDDIFKRIITWHFFKGDGKTFDIRWLKRRVIRFLFGENGTSFNIDQTYKVSVTFGVGNQVNINLSNGVGKITGGAIYNRFAFNSVAYNKTTSIFQQFAPIPNAAIFKQAVLAGVLELPFQFEFVVNID